jgi:hypothetical protein
MKNKKAFMFNIILVIISIIVLTAAFLVLLNKNLFDFDIGKRQFEIVKAADSAQDISLYIKESIKLSAAQAIYDLGIYGGYAKNQRCATFEDIAVWQRGDEACYPEDVQKNFDILLNENLNKYISQYPLPVGAKIPRDSYESLIYNNRLTVNSFENIELNIYEPPANAKISRYSLKPTYSIPAYYDLDIYQQTAEQAYDLFLLCRPFDDASQIKQCIESSLENPEFIDWIFLQADADKVFFFEVNTYQQAQIYENSKITPKDIAIRFVLYFGKSAVPPTPGTTSPTIPKPE